MILTVFLLLVKKFFITQLVGLNHCFNTFILQQTYHYEKNTT